MGVPPYFSKIENFGFGSQIDQMGAPIQDHIGKKLGLVHLTSLGAGDSDANRHFVFHQVR